VSAGIVRALTWALMLGVLLAGLPVAAGAEVRARIEPRIIDELETARLVLRTTGTAIRTLDLTALANDFEVLGTQTASQYQSMNGVVEAWVEYQITLRPTRAGEITIPPIEIDGERSQPVTLEVRGIDPALRAAIDGMVFFELEVTRNPVYVRGETVLVRRLYYSAQTQIYSDLPGPPELADALVMPIGETRSSSVDRNGQRYGVIEQRFAIFPERAGTLTVPPISLTSSVRLQIDGRVRRTGARVSSQALPIEVLPIPPEYPPDAPWLPATSLTLADTWSPEQARYAVGEPLQRTVDIRVEGNLAAAIAPLDDALPDTSFRQYPEPAVLADDRGGPSVVGRRTTEYAIIPTAPGSVALPELSVVWWDVDERRVRVARTTAAGTADRGHGECWLGTGRGRARLRARTPRATVRRSVIDRQGSSRALPDAVARAADRGGRLRPGLGRRCRPVAAAPAAPALAARLQAALRLAGLSGTRGGPREDCTCGGRPRIDDRGTPWGRRGAASRAGRLPRLLVSDFIHRCAAPVPRRRTWAVAGPAAGGTVRSRWRRVAGGGRMARSHPHPAPRDADHPRSPAGTVRAPLTSRTADATLLSRRRAPWSPPRTGPSTARPRPRPAPARPASPAADRIVSTPARQRRRQPRRDLRIAVIERDHRVREQRITPAIGGMEVAMVLLREHTIDRPQFVRIADVERRVRRQRTDPIGVIARTRGLQGKPLVHHQRLRPPALEEIRQQPLREFVRQAGTAGRLDQRGPAIGQVVGRKIERSSIAAPRSASSPRTR
jgi:hypothetical protein